MQETTELLRAVNRSADWARYTRGFWAPIAGLSVSAASLNRDLSYAAGSGPGAGAEVRLTLALATIAQAREDLDALQLAVAQAREEARR